MRTYTHAALSYLAADLAQDWLPEPGRAPRAALWAAAGAALPDLPALLGSAWLASRGSFTREAFYGEVCRRRRFGLPDTTLHSAMVFAPYACVVAAYSLSGSSDRRSREAACFTLGWAGHLAADFLTHASDARPQLWPLSRRRFKSPVSYRERGKGGLLFTLAEHAALVPTAYLILRRTSGAPSR